MKTLRIKFKKEKEARKMKKMLGLVLAVVMVLSMGGFAFADQPEGVQGVEEGYKQSVMFTVYTVVNLPCYLEVTLEGNEVGTPAHPAVTKVSKGDEQIIFDTWSNYPGAHWYMTFFEDQQENYNPTNVGSPVSGPGANKWLYDCSQTLPPIWHITIKATDTWRLYLLGGDLANEEGEKIRIQRKVSGAKTLGYANMAGGGEATPSNGSFGPASDSFATMIAQWIDTQGPTAGTSYYFRYRIPHTWTTPQGFFEGKMGYFVASYE